MRLQVAISKAAARGGRRYLPTPSPNSEWRCSRASSTAGARRQRAITANILIMRPFAQLRRAQRHYVERKVLWLRRAVLVEVVDLPTPTMTSRSVGLRARCKLSLA